MSATDPLQALRDQRAALLICEAIGWLHMAGKAHPDFVPDASKEIHDKAASKSGWKELEWASSLYNRFGTLPSIGTRAISPSDLFEKHRERNECVLGLLQAAHAMASGIEKNTPANYQKQPLGQTWLTSAFGHAVKNLLGSQPPAILASGAWSSTERQIGVLIDALAERVKDPTNLDEWRKWRDGAIGLSGWLREAFTSTLADTRVPNNDVTLWDQSFIAAALFKAAAAGTVLSDSSFDWGHGIKANTCWRVLTVGIGSEHYEARAVRIGDWTGTREAIKTFFDEVCAFIEVDLALGACVYRDERTLALTFPGQRLDGKGSVDNTLAETLRASIEQEVDDLAQSRAFAFETPPLVRLSPSTRSFIAMSRELAEVRQMLEVPVHRAWSIASDGSTGKHVCPVSLVRAGEPSNNESNRKQDISRSCDERRKGRRDPREKNRGDTIWISEVADANDRVALLTFSLGLEGWLDGTHVDSLRAQSLPTWSQSVSLSQGIATPTTHAELAALLEKALPKKGNDPAKIRAQLLKKLSAGFEENDWPSPFYENIVEDRAGAPPWSSLNDTTRAAWLAHQLFRKNASPGRVHRFWRTTRTFFDEALAEFCQLVSRDSGTRTLRLSLKLSGDTDGVRVREVYAGHLSIAPNAPFEVLRRSSGFVTVCNLARVLGPDGDAARLKGMQFEARGDDGHRRRFTIDSATAAEGVLASYRPLIVLEENPERFRVLVPLAPAEACVEHVIAKWRKEMARVWDRLPLRVGVIGFPRKLPFQAVIEATRNVEDDLARGGVALPWRVSQVATQSGTTTLSFVRPDGGREAVGMPTQLADGRDDVYYPNLAVGGAEREPHDFTAPRPDGTSVVYRRAADLKVGDDVYVEPSRFALLFLDSTARRFDPVQVHPLSEWDRRHTVWELVRKALPGPTAARAVEQSLREARERWTDPDGTLDQTAWSTWVRAVLANEWNASARDLQDLEQAARDGLLERVLNWHMHVLKEKME